MEIIRWKLTKTSQCAFWYVRFYWVKATHYIVEKMETYKKKFTLKFYHFTTLYRMAKHTGLILYLGTCKYLRCEIFQDKPLGSSWAAAVAPTGTWRCTEWNHNQQTKSNLCEVLDGKTSGKVSSRCHLATKCGQTVPYLVVVVIVVAVYPAFYT